MASHCLSLEDRPLPNRCQQPAGLIITDPCDQIFDQLHVLAVRKDDGVFLLIGLEHTESGISSIVNDQDILHSNIVTVSDGSGNS